MFMAAGHQSKMKILIYVVELLILSSSVLSGRRTSRAGYAFPDKFSFGAAENAYQMEGAWNEDGKGPSIWDTFTHNHPEKIADRSNADVTGDSYHLYNVEDIKAVKTIESDHYCFSIAWSRIFPDGYSLNLQGIAFYNSWIDTYIANGVEPIVAMFRYDLPQALQDEGGFMNETIIDRFEEYVDALYHYFGDRVKKWITFDSPSSLCTLIYGNGYMAPTITPTSKFGEYTCGANVLKAHARAYRLYYKRYAKRYKGKVGITFFSEYYYSETGNDYDVRKAFAFQLGWFADPILGKGDYPSILKYEIAKLSRRKGYSYSQLPKLSERWKKKIRGTADFMGLNYFTSRIVESTSQRQDYETLLYFSANAYLKYTVRPEWKRANSSYIFSVPSGLGHLTRYIKKRYKNPKVLITRNGWSDEGQLVDLDRIDYIRAHLKEILISIHEYGCNIFGYTVWALYNCFEYREGYTAKTGLFDVNYASPRLPLTPKASAEYMRQVSSTHRIPKKFKIKAYSADTYPFKL